jgi:4-hydroxybenzoate polyprenyltransferase
MNPSEKPVPSVRDDRAGSSRRESTPPSSPGLATDLRQRPLCVDLDGTLLRTDSAQERFLIFLKRCFWRTWMLPFWLWRGRAHLKHMLASHTTLAVDRLPLSEEFLAFLRAEKAAGRRLILATGADEHTARAVADHLGLFDQVLATDSEINLTAERKRRRLVESFGEKGFDYAGNSKADLPVWGSAGEAILVNASTRLEGAARDRANVTRVFHRPPFRATTWLRLVRVQQWPKNLLLLLPVITGHELMHPAILGSAALGILAFCLCDSSVYIVSDLHDIEADRQHPSKRDRPFASGQVPVSMGVVLAPILLALGVTCAWWLPRVFLAYLAIYYLSSTLYSWSLKKIVWLGTFVLAGVYTIRILAGHGATGIAYSSWLLGFSVFLFLSLALVKRYVELQQFQAVGNRNLTGASRPRSAIKPGILKLVNWLL